MNTPQLSQHRNWLTFFDESILHLTLFMTEQCNFRCVYCYEDFKLGKIQAKVIEGVKNLILKRLSELKVLKIGYFGGEPLMNKKRVLEVGEWAKKLCSENGITFVSNITTNGYSLDKQTFSSLIQAGCHHYQVTLDGDQAWHDASRPTQNGKPTFSKILKNLQAMQASSHDFQCLLRMNVADSNLKGVREFLIHHPSIFAGDSRFRLHFHPIWGLPEMKLTLQNELQKLQKLASELGYQINGMVNEKGRATDYVCYAAKATSFVIRANGKVQKCTVAVNNPLNDIGKLHPNGNLELDSEKMKRWVFAENKACPLKGFELEKLAVAYENAGKFVN